MMYRLYIIILMSIAPCLALAQTEGVDSLAVVCDSSAVAEGSHVEVADSLHAHGVGAIINTLQNYGFEADGLHINKHAKEEYWEHVPADCHIKWRRKRERPLIDFGLDLARFFNTYDTTYVERNRYNFRVMATNTDFFQIYRIAGRDNEIGVRQILTFVPVNAIKFGPRLGWRWLMLGYTRSIKAEEGQKTQELNVAAYNSRIGCDMNWQHSTGPFNLRRVRGVSGLPEYSVRGTEVGGISTNTLALNVYYVYNYRHFSYPAAYNACTVQIKSAGSWILGASYDYQRFNFDPDEAERTIQQVYRTVHPDATETPALIGALRVKDVNYHRIGVNIGYAYNWVPAPGWLVSASLSPSFGFKKQVGEDISKEMIADNFRNFHVDAIIRGAVVYNRQRWFLGASVVNYLYDYRHRNFDLNNNVTYIKAYVGVQLLKRKRFRLAGERSPW